MRDQQGYIDELDRVQDTKSASRFSLYELKAMSKQGDIGGFWRIIFPVQKLGRGDAAPSKGGETTKGESSSEIASRQRCVNGQGGCQRVRPGR